MVIARYLLISLCFILLIFCLFLRGLEEILRMSFQEIGSRHYKDFLEEYTVCTYNTIHPFWSPPHTTKQ